MRKIALTVLVVVSAAAAVVAVHEAVPEPPGTARATTRTGQPIDRHDLPQISIEQLHADRNLLKHAAPTAAPQLLYTNWESPANDTDGTSPLY